MNYILELKSFYDWIESHPIGSKALTLWYALMAVNNKTGWKKEFTVSLTVLETKTFLSKSDIYRARRVLESEGRIKWQERGGNLCAAYSMISFEEENFQNYSRKSDASPDGQSNGNPSSDTNINHGNSYSEPDGCQDDCQAGYQVDFQDRYQNCHTNDFCIEKSQTNHRPECNSSCQPNATSVQSPACQPNNQSNATINKPNKTKINKTKQNINSLKRNDDKSSFVINEVDDTPPPFFYVNEKFNSDSKKNNFESPKGTSENHTILSKDEKQIFTGGRGANNKVKDVAKGKDKKYSVDNQRYINLYNHMCLEMSKAIKLTKKRKDLIRGRFFEFGDQQIIQMLKKASKSTFLNGENANFWRANFDWLFKQDNFVKVIEGYYDEIDNEFIEISETNLDEIKETNESVSEFRGITINLNPFDF